MQILLVISRRALFGTERALFSSWPDSQGTGNTSTKPRDLLLVRDKGSKGLDHERPGASCLLLLVRRSLGLSWVDFLLRFWFL